MMNCVYHNANPWLELNKCWSLWLLLHRWCQTKNKGLQSAYFCWPATLKSLTLHRYSIIIVNLNNIACLPLSLLSLFLLPLSLLPLFLPPPGLCARFRVILKYYPLSIICIVKSENIIFLKSRWNYTEIHRSLFRLNISFSLPSLSKHCTCILKQNYFLSFKNSKGKSFPNSRHYGALWT